MILKIYGVNLSDQEKSMLTAANREGSQIGTIQYRKASGEAGDVGGYFFKSQTTPFTKQIATTGSAEEAKVGSLIESKMISAKTAVGESVDFFNQAGVKIGTVVGGNTAADQIVDIGMTNLQQTQFNQQLSNLKKIEAARTSVTPITAENIQERASISSKAYGMGASEIPAEAHLAEKGVAFRSVLANSQADNYSDDVIKSGLAYGNIDPSSRIIGVGTSRATAQTLAQASQMKGSSIAPTIRIIG